MQKTQAFEFISLPIESEPRAATKAEFDAIPNMVVPMAVPFPTVSSPLSLPVPGPTSIASAFNGPGAPLAAKLTLKGDIESGGYVKCLGIDFQLPSSYPQVLTNYQTVEGDATCNPGCFSGQVVTWRLTKIGNLHTLHIGRLSGTAGSSVSPGQNVQRITFDKDITEFFPTQFQGYQCIGIQTTGTTIAQGFAGLLNTGVNAMDILDSAAIAAQQWQVGANQGWSAFSLSWIK